MTVDQKNAPPCFGNLDTVFPMGKEGLRQTPEACMRCPEKTACLRKAMAAGSGVIVREEVVDRAYASGMLGFFERWSRKKALNRQKGRRNKT